MKTLELFSGTQSFSKVARELGHETFCIDNNQKFGNDLTYDFCSGISPDIWDEIRSSDIIWMSPPCTTFSMAAGNTHWNADRSPKTREAVYGKQFIDMCWIIARHCIDNNKIFFIENPRARARWFLPVECRKTVWYCKYGDTRAKPTDIWTNLKDWNPRTCHNFLKNKPKHCHHEAAPRGSKTGTQGLKGNMERSVIPRELFIEIFNYIAVCNDIATQSEDSKNKYEKELNLLEECGCHACTLCEHRSFLERQINKTTQSEDSGKFKGEDK